LKEKKKAIIKHILLKHKNKPENFMMMEFFFAPPKKPFAIELKEKTKLQWNCIMDKDYNDNERNEGFLISF